MYRCTECKEEFKEKPDYCTCGNDEFEEFTPAAQSTAVSEIPDKNFHRTSEAEENELPAQKPDRARIFSITFFCLCLIFAIIPWLIKTEKTVKIVQKPEKEVAKTIPDVEKLWNNTPPKATTPVNTQKQLPAVTTEKTTQKPIQTTPKTSPSKPSNTPVTKPVPLPSTSTPSKPAQTQKPVQKPATAKNSEAKPASARTTKPKLPQSVLNPSTATSSQTTTAKPVQNQTTATASQKPAQKQETPKMSQTEFLNYKGSIRSALLAKLNVASVQGSGDCAVEFSLDSSGKLINRQFIYKSQNKSVNDEVYLMLMRLPYYKTPPAHYNGEKIKLKFLFNNGYYEITFI